MVFKRVLIIAMIFFVMSSMLLGCSQETTKSQETSQEKQGTQLVLTGVDKNLESVFKENFNIVEKAHQDLIYRQDTIVSGLPQTFTEDRPDLKNANLLYNAETNEAIFTYFYKPRQDDLYVSPSFPQMNVKLASYHYIATSVAFYFDKVIGIMKTQGVSMEFPKIYTAFLVNENQYLQIDQTERFYLILDVKIPAQKDPVHIKAGFASGLIQASVAKPNKLVSGEYSQEISLLEFFDVSPNALTIHTSTPTSSDEPKEQISSHNLLPNSASLSLSSDSESDHRIALDAAIRSEAVDEVKSVLDAGVDTEWVSPVDGETPLTRAAGLSSEKNNIAMAILQAGADPNFPNTEEVTALMVASTKGNIDLVKALLAKSADPNKENNDGLTALSLAENFQEIVFLLKQAGAK